MKGQKIDNGCLRFILAWDSPTTSPAFVMDADKLRANAAILADIQDATGVKILLALKGYAAFSTFNLLSRAKNGPLWGACASSVDEARLAYEEFGGEVHAFAAAWSEAEIQELLALVDHITFNSLTQWKNLFPLIQQANGNQRKTKPIKCGLRVNPEYSAGATAIYNPCAPGSRLGVRQKELLKAETADLSGMTGLHFHTLCEQNADALAATLTAFEAKFIPYLPSCQWLNFGGGHHITRPDYDRNWLKRLLIAWRDKYHCQIYLEPGEAVALNAGWLLATVLDIVEADIPIAILDVSASCHMPDVLEMPYRPNVWSMENGSPQIAGQPGEKAWTCRLAGKSCLAGDIIGEYSFSYPLNSGDKLAFADMAIYSMVKTTTFNGLRLPAIGIYDAKAENKFRVQRQFGYEDFKGRLS